MGTWNGVKKYFNPIRGPYFYNHLSPKNVVTLHFLVFPFLFIIIILNLQFYEKYTGIIPPPSPVAPRVNVNVHFVMERVP